MRKETPPRSRWSSQFWTKRAGSVENHSGPENRHGKTETGGDGGKGGRGHKVVDGGGTGKER